MKPITAVRFLLLIVMLTFISFSCSKTPDPSPGLPSLTTTPVTAISLVGATSGGNITSDGGSPILVRGVCWSKVANPTTNDSNTSDGNGTGNFTSTISGLNSGTQYFLRAYASNSTGIAYGNSVTFTTPSATDIDGNTYRTVTIGTQVWMVDNLKATRYNDGTAIPLITSNTSWAAASSGAYAYYSNDAANKNTYGGIYNWYAVASGKLAPSGWHVANDADWAILTGYLGSLGPGKLKEAGTSHWESPNTGATNESGFTGLPGGLRYTDGSFLFMGHAGYWWSSSLSGNGPAANKGLLSTSGDTYFGNYQLPLMGYSVRCVKD